MEFCIGFLLGGIATGVTVGNWSTLLKALQAFKSKIQSAVQSKVAARIAALKSKL